METNILRAILVDVVANLIAAESIQARLKSETHSNRSSDLHHARTMSEGCIDSSPFTCESSYSCDPQEGTSRFFCNDDPSEQPKAFDCDYSSEFTCDAMYFDCTGDFACTGSTEFHCDAELFQCQSYREGESVGKFDCTGGGSKSFDCTDGSTYDFMCDREPIGSPAGYECTDADFACSTKHIFRCWSSFSCPTSHHCSPPRRACPQAPDELWSAPPGDDDDGNAGDFDCMNFGCAASPPQHSSEKFDCQAGSQFKCLDRSGGKFDCGENSIFECGDEGEGFVCHDYDCSTPFDCVHQHVCRKDPLGGESGFDCNTFTCVTASRSGASDMFHCPEEGETPDFNCGEDSEDFVCADQKFNCGFVEYLCAAQFECPEGYECNVEGQPHECSSQFECTQDFECTHAHDCAEQFSCNEYSCCVVVITPDDTFTCPPEGFSCDSFSCGQGWSPP